jgi:hypothetical protein
MIGLAHGAQRAAAASTGQRADAAAFEACGHARAGDSTTADRKLRDARDLAEALTDRPQDQRPWLYWLTPAVIADEEGITAAHLAGHWLSLAPPCGGAADISARDRRDAAVGGGEEFDLAGVRARSGR